MLIPDVNRDFSFSDVLQASGATRSDLMSLLRAHVVKGSAKETTGKGDHRRFTADDVLAVRMALELKRQGVGSRYQRALVTEALSGLMRVSRRLGQALPPAVLVRAAGPRAVEVLVPERIESAPTGVLLNVATMITETKDAIARLP